MGRLLPATRRFLSDRESSGAAMAEFAIAFPLQLFITFALMQMTLVYVSTLLVNFAAYRACRAATVMAWTKTETYDSSSALWDDMKQFDYNGDNTVNSEDMEENARHAAQVVLSPVAGAFRDEAYTTDVEPVKVPGWGDTLHNSAAAYVRTLAYDPGTEPASSTTTGTVTIVVEFDQPLVFPMVDRLFALFLSDERSTADPNEGTGMVYGNRGGTFTASSYMDREPIYDIERHGIKEGVGTVRKIDNGYSLWIGRECTLPYTIRATAN